MEMVFHASRAADLVDSAEDLRAIGWTELCARLVAAQDLRRSFGADDVAGASGIAGSFHRAAARALARQREGEGAVNPNPSGDGKGPSGNTSGEATFRHEQG
ncbi:MAG: hypothetical protein KGL48_11640 [Sphingomonadales bacterium]|nr:hypothetical protein [Sphingomonadales bacterium]MDE2569809.1 hypothetical protein [Sphingomonadales bacterium]